MIYIIMGIVMKYKKKPIIFLYLELITESFILISVTYIVLNYRIIEMF